MAGVLLAASGWCEGTTLPVNLPEGTPLWKLVAQSDVVIEGTVEVPATLAKASKSYVSLPVAEAELLKGNWATPKLLITHYASRPAADYMVPQEKLEAQQEKKSVAFLAIVDEARENGAGEKPMLFFAGYTKDALQPSSPQFLEQVRKEIAAQAKLLQSFSTSALAKPDARHAAVAALIEQMVVEKTEAKAFEKLEEMGLAAVPSIIRLLDDRRELPLKYIRLNNKGAVGAFEGFRQYGPATVGEALDAILNQLTGEDFGGSWFYNNLRAHRKSVAGWRVWLAHQKSDEPVPVK